MFNVTVFLKDSTLEFNNAIEVEVVDTHLFILDSDKRGIYINNNSWVSFISEVVK
jgi:hypothetical protein